jgi:hypothetical protein
MELLKGVAVKDRLKVIKLYFMLLTLFSIKLEKLECTKKVLSLVHYSYVSKIQHKIEFYNFDQLALYYKIYYCGSISYCSSVS